MEPVVLELIMLNDLFKILYCFINMQENVTFISVSGSLSFMHFENEILFSIQPLSIYVLSSIN